MNTIKASEIYSWVIERFRDTPEIQAAVLNNRLKIKRHGNILPSDFEMLEVLYDACRLLVAQNNRLILEYKDLKMKQPCKIIYVEKPTVY